MMKKFILYSFFLLLFSNVSFGQKKSKNKNKGRVNQSNTSFSLEDKVKAERLFFDGHKEKQKENYFEALRNFEQATKAYAKLDAAWFEIAQIKLQQKDIKNALSSIDKALKISPKNNWYREFYGQLLSLSGSFEKARVVYNNLRKDYPYNSAYYYDEAFFLLKQNKDNEAIKIYNELESLMGVQKEISLQKYKIFLKQSDIESAELELVQLNKTYPNNLEYLNRLAKFHLLNNQLDKAENTLKTILQKDFENTSALLSLADLYKAKGDEKNYKIYSKKAFSSPNLDIDTKITVLYNSINQFQNNQIDNLDDALEYAELISVAHPDNAKSWAIYGDLYNLTGQSEKALEKYEHSLDLEQGVFTVWQQVFFIQSDLKNFDQLVHTTNAAKELFPNQSLVYFFNGLAYQQTKNAEKAINSYERGVKMAVNQPALQTQYYSNLGELYNEIQNFEKSDINFEKSLDIEPNNQFTLNNYAYYLSLRAENLLKAKKMSEQSLKISPDNPTYLDTYAWILFKNAEYKLALETQEQALKLSDKPSSEMYEHYGDILYKLNRAKEAKEYWEKAKELGKTNANLDLKIQSGKI